MAPAFHRLDRYEPPSRECRDIVLLQTRCDTGRHSYPLRLQFSHLQSGTQREPFVAHGITLSPQPLQHQSRCDPRLPKAFPSFLSEIGQRIENGVWFVAARRCKIFASRKITFAEKAVSLACK
jgi:hypothetical protein